MASWKGNSSNPAPNSVQSDVSRSEKRIEDNRSHQVRRDVDTQKDNEITLMDVDKVVLDQLEKMQITVVDEGNQVKVPVFYGSMEKWVSARRDGYIRDNQGKIQLPAMIFTRTNSENNDDIEIFHKYVNYPVIRKYSTKNKYTQFSLLTKTTAPTNEVFNIRMADHMVFTYSFIVWTEYHEQMNPIIEKIKYNTKDYWGSPRGFRFLCRTEGFNHTIELTADDDRMVRTEFNLIINGYILPESYHVLDRQYPSTEKLFTPKKVVIGIEVTENDISNGYSYPTDKWKSQNYPNLDKGQEPIQPQITWVDGGNFENLSPAARNFVSSLKLAQTANGWEASTSAQTNILWQSPPASPDSAGEDGWVAKDSNYLYVYTNGSWTRIPLANYT
jgi:hypothetical protein